MGAVLFPIEVAFRPLTLCLLELIPVRGNTVPKCLRNRVLRTLFPGAPLEFHFHLNRAINNSQSE